VLLAAAGHMPPPPNPHSPCALPSTPAPPPRTPALPAFPSAVCRPGNNGVALATADFLCCCCCRRLAGDCREAASSRAGRPAAAAAVRQCLTSKGAMLYVVGVQCIVACTADGGCLVAWSDWPGSCWCWASSLDVHICIYNSLLQTRQKREQSKCTGGGAKGSCSGQYEVLAGPA
jgi:hypothetical protein